jgi:hypothetical protein
MKRWTNYAMAGLLLGSLAFYVIPVCAQGVNDPNIQQREQYKQQRIQQGIGAGQLTPGEANRLEAQQGRIQAREDRMKADGNLSTAERARLTRQENRSSRNIYRKKHNNRTAATQ